MRGVLREEPQEHLGDVLLRTEGRSPSLSAAVELQRKGCEFRVREYDLKTCSFLVAHQDSFSERNTHLFEIGTWIDDKILLHLQRVRSISLWLVMLQIDW